MGKGWIRSIVYFQNSDLPIEHSVRWYGAAVFFSQINDFSRKSRDFGGTLPLDILKRRADMVVGVWDQNFEQLFFCMHQR